MSLLFTYLSVAATFVALDMIWLKTMVERLYRPVLGDMLRSEPDLAAAAVFYLAYPVGLIWFAVLPSQQDGGALRAFTSAA
ncbi:putative membrane protein [Bradyrhizobium sp. F1.13.4]